jgi:hypothetical protein
VLNNEIDWRIKLKIIESLQKKQAKNQAKKKGTRTKFENFKK